jgi:hypothetical protein
VPGALGVAIVDVSTPTAPRELGLIRTSSPVPGLTVVGRRAYLAVRELGLQIYDVANPARPVALGAYQSTCGATRSCNARDVEVAGTYAVVHGAAAPEVVDVSDDARPRAVGSFSSFATDVDFDGSYAYALCGQEGSRVLDLTDPTSPRTIAKLASGVGCQGVASIGPRVYLSGDTGLRVVDVSDPRCPREVGAYDILAQSLGNSRLVVGRGLVYIDEGPAGVYLLRPTGPAALVAPPTVAAHSRIVLPILAQRSGRAPTC